MSTRDEKKIAQLIGDAIIAAIREIIGEAHQFQIAELIGEDPGTLSKIIRGNNANATRPLNWLKYWNENQEKKLIFAFDGENVSVRPRKVQKSSAA